MSVEELRQRSRRALHRKMGRPCRYYPMPRVDEPASEIIDARYHSKDARAGDLAGTNLNYAETLDRQDKLILLRAEVPSPTAMGLYVFTATEGYFTSAVRPPDGITITVEVFAAEPSDLIGYALPDEAGTIIT